MKRHPDQLDLEITVKAGPEGAAGTVKLVELGDGKVVDHLGRPIHGALVKAPPGAKVGAFRKIRGGRR